MAEVIKEFWAGMPLGLYIILILAFLLLVASWIVPPLGVIAPSALQGAALILGAAWLFYTTTHIPQILSSGAKIKASYGNANIEIGKKVEPETEEKEKENLED